MPTATTDGPGERTSPAGSAQEDQVVGAVAARPGWAVPGYDIEELIGFGATGEVWRARERASGRLVALKRVRGRGGVAERDRLRHEAALMAGVVSAHLVRLRTVLTTGDGLVLVLDFAGGGTLAALLGTRRRLQPGEVVAVAAPLARALADVHRAGLIHGDVSPANVLFTTDGRPLLSDFGVGRLVGDGSAASVTAAYADPAVLAGAAPTPGADVYGLAAVCHAALTGSPPYPGEDAAEVLAAVQAGRRARLALARPLLPAALADAVETALDPDPAARPHAAAFATMLEAAAVPSPIRLAGASVPVVSAPTYRVAKQREPDPDDTAGPDRGPVSGALATVGGWLRRRAGLARPLLAVLAGLAAVTVCVAAGARWASAGAAGHPASLPSALPTSPATTGRPAVPPSTGGPARRAPAGALPLLRRLDAVRDSAFVTGDAGRLAAAYVAGSPPYRADAATLAVLVAGGQHAEGLALRVGKVTLVDHSPRTMLLDVVDRLPPYRVVAADGAVVLRSPGRGDRRWRVLLRRTDEGWRIARVTPTADRRPGR